MVGVFRLSDHRRIVNVDGHFIVENIINRWKGSSFIMP